MRRVFLVAVAALAVFCLPGFGRSVVPTGSNDIRLSRPNTSYAAFMDDRNACLSAASHRRFYSSSAPGLALLSVRYDLYEFADCMNTKGYLLDPHGYRAAAYVRMGDGKILFTPDPL